MGREKCLKGNNEIRAEEIKQVNTLEVERETICIYNNNKSITEKYMKQVDTRQSRI